MHLDKIDFINFLNRETCTEGPCDYKSEICTAMNVNLFAITIKSQLFGTPLNNKISIGPGWPIFFGKHHDVV